MKTAPRALKAGGKTLWKQVVDGWEVPDEQLQVLENVCRCQDRIDRLTRTVDREGMTMKGRFGQAVAHPAALLLRSEVANFSALYRLLMLDAPSGDAGRAGRPDGWEGGE